MERILVSGCLLGRKIRYNGTDKAVGKGEATNLLARWQEEGRLVPICPELSAGFSTPRPPAETPWCAGKAPSTLRPVTLSP